MKILMVAAMIGLPFAAMAGQQPSGAPGAPDTSAQSNSYSGSAAGALAGGGAASITQNYSAPGRQEVDATPSGISAPAIYAGTCTGVAASFGVAVMNTGVSGGVAKESGPCNTRADIGVAVTVLDNPALGVQIACEDSTFAAAYARLPNDPCPNAPARPVQTVAMVTPAPAPVPVPVAAPVCRQVFVPPADPNGAGYMAQECGPPTPSP